MVWKKIISVTLSFVITLLPIINSYASNIDYYNQHDDTIILTYGDHGTLRKVDKSNISKNIQPLSSEEKESFFIAKSTGDNEVYYISEDQYALFVDNDTFVLSTKVDLINEDQSVNIDKIDAYKIPKDMKEEIVKAAQQQKTIGNNDFEISVFVPYNKSQSNEIVTYGSPITEETNYYSYNGYRLRDWIVRYTHMSFGGEKVGSKVIDIAKSFTGLIITVGSNIEKVSLFFDAAGAATTLFDVVSSLHGTIKHGSTSDRVYSYTIYNKIEKQTQVDNNGVWSVGVNSRKVWLDKTETRNYYASTGKTFDKTNIINKSIYSENFNNPAPQAINWYQNMGISDSLIKGTVLNEKYIL